MPNIQFKACVLGEKHDLTDTNYYIKSAYTVVIRIDL